ncbi:hypothetical protein BCV70DRAFT_189823 [Testicularia cyperi]|uniref:Acyltransferase 3 domain-containing protein n=1 Tax=Testicularia cyperi TaxID=1882483 RepID=A0A317XQ97_9BASI|nr:hypothetical protein BCV70DRAFT_189823 [Testicularia cyperi]
MASRYSMSAEMPATRKSIHRSIRRQGGQAGPLPELHEQQQQQQQPLYPSEKISVRPVNERADGPTAAAPLNPASKFETDSDPSHDERGYAILTGADRWGLTQKPFLAEDLNDEGRTRNTRLRYIEGLRGILGLQVLIWTFFRIFAPAIVVDRDIDGIYPATFTSTSPSWQNVLRKALSPLLFNGDLQAAFFVIISGRVSLQTFVERRNAISLSGPAFKRPFRFIPPVAITLALVTLVVAVNGFRYADEMATDLNNQLARAPVQWNSALEFFNSLAFYFFTPDAYKTARAVQFLPPSGIMWFIPILFQQTYVMIIIAFILPVTIFRYKTLGMVLLILTTAWVGRWSWYTLTGLMLAEYSTIYLQMLPKQGIPITRSGSRHIAAWIPGVVFTLLGIFFKYLWIAALPADANNEIVAHVDGSTGKLNYSTDPAEIAYPRYDNWLLATGVLYLIELSPVAKRVLAIKPLAYLGRLSFSIALISGTVMLSLGSFLYHFFVVNQGWNSDAGLLGVLFVILVPASLVIAELYARIIDDTTLFATKWLFKWIRV